MIHAARKAGTFLGEAFMYRCHPQTAKLVELIRSGVIGEVRMIKSSFGFAMPRFMPEHRLYANDLAGGGILDVGGYPVSMARLIAGAAVGKPFAEPDKVVGVGASRPVGGRRMVLRPAAFSRWHRCRSLLQHLARTGQYAAHPGHGRSHRGQGFLVRRRQGRRHRQDRRDRPRRQQSDHRGAGDALALCIRSRCRGRGYSRRPPGIGMAGHGLGRQSRQSRVLDRWRASVRLEYEIETAARCPNTISGRPLRSGGTTHRKSARSWASPKPASMVALGFEDFRSFSSGAILLDAFFEAGGNLFDTGYV